MKHFIIPLLLLGSCAHKTHTTSADLPIWVNSPYEFCSDKTHWCAVGEAKGLAAAEASARAGIAAIFEVKVQSDLSSLQRMEQKETWAHDYQTATQLVKTEVEDVLEKVQITQRLKNQSMTYALAQLDLSQAQSLIASKISPVDEEIKTWWKHSPRFSFRRVSFLYKQRELLNEKMRLLGREIKSPLSLTDLDQQKKSWKVENLSIDGKKALPLWLSSWFKEYLTQLKFVVSDSASEKFTTNWTETEEFINVRGFKKISFVLNVKYHQKTLSFQHTMTARSIEDARLVVKNKLIEELESKLSELDL